MWRDFNEVQTKPATEVDLSASARSSIRRQPAARHNPQSSRPRSQGVPPRVDRRELLELIRRDRQNAARAAAHIPTRDEVQEGLADYERREASNRRRLESGRALLRDALSYEQPGQRMRQIPESALRYEIPPTVPSMPDHSRLEPETRGELVRVVHDEAQWSPPPQYMPTPPYVSTDAMEHTPVDSAPLYDHLPPLTRQAARVPSLTPRFAPAYRHEDPPDTLQQESFRRTRRADILNSGEGYDYGHHSLRRNRHRSAHDSSNHLPSQAAVDHADGLGDRRRSFSLEENTWETLLTTITPDEHLPTPSSSFVSATVSASSLSSNSTPPAPTLSTLLSSRSETINTVSNVCDDPTDSECSDTDGGYVTAGHQDHLNEPSPPVSSRYPAHVRPTARQESQEINDHFARVIRRTDQEIEYQRMHAMIERMDRQEPIPDEWWATAGLSRNVSGRVDRSERERL